MARSRQLLVDISWLGIVGAAVPTVSDYFACFVYWKACLPRGARFPVGPLVQGGKERELRGLVQLPAFPFSFVLFNMTSRVK